MSVLFLTHEAYLEHVTGPSHPERPSRLQAVVAGAKVGEVADALVPLVPQEATRADLERVHPAGTWTGSIASPRPAVGGSTPTPA